jgi:calpain-15
LSPADYEPCFSRANGKELWVLILEKVWAKLHGSYERIESGSGYEVLRDLLGAPAYSYKTDRSDVFQKILHADKSDYIMTSSVHPHDGEGQQKLKELGLVGLHSYGLLGAAEVSDKNGNQVKLI